MKAFRHGLAAVLLATLSVTALPAQARWGFTPVDTWARFEDRIAGHNDGSGLLRVWVHAGSARRVIWSIENLGGGTPKLSQVTFHGCDDANGFRFRYVTPAGQDVTWSVTHDGYVAESVSAGDRAWLDVVITSTVRDRSRTCVLEGEGMVGTDTVQVWAHS
jgi:hypothetical protein